MKTKTDPKFFTGNSMWSVQQAYDPSLYVESDTPPSEQKNKGWYWHPPTRKYYRWDNMPKGD